MMPDIIIHGASSFLGKHFIRSLTENQIHLTVLARETSLIPFCENNPLVSVHRYRKTLSELKSGEIKVKHPVFIEFSWHGVFGAQRNEKEQLSVNLPLITSSVNFAGALNSRHWIGIGSQAEYGNPNKIISEDHACNPTTLYGEAKLQCCHLSAELCRKYGIDHSWLRLFSVYGPDDNHDWLIQYLIKEMLQDKEINVTKSEQKWDYLFVDDAIKMFLKLINAGGIGVANLGSGKAVPIRYIIETIKEITKSASKINFGAVDYRPDQVMFMQADITKLSNHLNWFPETSLEQGLILTIEFLKKQFSWR